MTERFTRFINKYIWITILLFCGRCLILGDISIESLSLYDLYGYVGESLSFSTFIMIFYERYLWRYDCFEDTPVLKKKYSGTFVSTYDGITREATLEVKQTLLSVQVSLKSGESKSNSVTAAIDKIQNEWQLVYCYLNDPNAKVRERSPIHYGTARLCIESENKLTGKYFTDRKTTGDMWFEAVWIKNL